MNQNIKKSYDLIFIGGGIGGGALATVMARSGYSVLVLEKSEVYRDKVRGEIMANWGVAETKLLGLYDELISAGAHHLTRHITYGDTFDPIQAEKDAQNLDVFVSGILGTLAFGHPAHCNLLNDTSIKAGVNVIRGVQDVEVFLGVDPLVKFFLGDTQYSIQSRLIVGADGRGSVVRKAANIDIQKNPNHHLFAGMLVENAHGFPEDLEAMGTEEDIHYLVFPQGNGRVRLYVGYSSIQRKRFAGINGQKSFLDSFKKLKFFPYSNIFINATPAGPCNSFPNEDGWVNTPYSQGMVLIGDAAGWNDPTIGQGLSITYRDVRLVSDILKKYEDWSSPVIFESYAEERQKRMERLRFCGELVAQIRCEFGEDAKKIRLLIQKRQVENPDLTLPFLAILTGPNDIPEAAFEKSVKEKLFN